MEKKSQQHGLQQFPPFNLERYVIFKPYMNFHYYTLLSGHGTYCQGLVDIEVFGEKLDWILEFFYNFNDSVFFVFHMIFSVCTLFYLGHFSGYYHTKILTPPRLMSQSSLKHCKGT